MNDFQTSSTYEKALKIIQEIPESDLDERYKDVVDDYTDFDGRIIPEIVYDFAEELAFCNMTEQIPQMLREFIVCAMLDEIEKDNPEAMLNLGALYYTGRIGEQNFKEAVRYYKMSASYGNLIACENLGYCYYYGRDVEVDYKTAYHYFIKSALAGRLESLYKIGDMYSKGLYVEKDTDTAFRLYKRAYNYMDEDCDVAGDIYLRMGNCYYYANGCERDIKQALYFYQRSEECFYEQIKNGDFFKKKILLGVIDKINAIREELKNELHLS